MNRLDEASSKTRPGQLHWGPMWPFDRAPNGGVLIVEFAELQEQWDLLQGTRSARRTDLDDPAARVIEPLRHAEAVAIKAVALRNVADLRCLHDLVLRPVLHEGLSLWVQCSQTLWELDEAAFRDEFYGHAFTLERARWLAQKASVGSAALPRDEDPALAVGLDREQARAACAGGGVVQIIAPAGSGKTTTLLARTQRLLARGISAERILLTTFNRAAKDELNARLRQLGLPAMASTFHATGWALMPDYFRTRELAPDLTPPQRRRLASMACKGLSAELEPDDLPSQIEDLKLGLLLTPKEALARPDLSDEERAVTRAYRLFEQGLEREGQFSFADMIFLPVRRLREDPVFRAAAQARFDAILVDEFQDTEPAQQLLVSILAAPQDELTVVGDADQVLYEWRRASVETVVTFDSEYPGLRRVALATNYRCTPEAVQGATMLTSLNTLRFPLTINHSPARDHGQEPHAIRVHAADEASAAVQLATKLTRAVRDALGANPDERLEEARQSIVVLARTVDALRPFAAAAARAGLRLDGHDQLFESAGALRTIEAYTAVFAHPQTADPADAAIVLRRPGRGLSREQTVHEFVRALHDEQPPSVAIRHVSEDEWKRDKACQAFASLTEKLQDAAAFVTAVRTGGLDTYYGHGTADPSNDQLDALERCTQDAAGHTVATYHELLVDQADVLRKSYAKGKGLELNTVHGAKGRQWRKVVVVAFEEGVMPHKAALKNGSLKAIEAERRVAYVAMTRATHELSLLHSPGTASRFLHQAGYLATAPPEWKPPTGNTNDTDFRKSPEGRKRAQPARGQQPPEQLERHRDVARVGVSYAIRAAPTRRVALEFVRYLIDSTEILAAGSTGSNITVGQAIDALDEGTPEDRQILQRTAHGQGVTHTELGHLNDDDKRALNDAIRIRLER